MMSKKRKKAEYLKIITLLDISYNRKSWRDEFRENQNLKQEVTLKIITTKNNWDKYNVNRAKKTLNILT